MLKWALGIHPSTAVQMFSTGFSKVMSSFLFFFCEIFSKPPRVLEQLHSFQTLALFLFVISSVKLRHEHSLLYLGYCNVWHILAENESISLVNLELKTIFSYWGNTAWVLIIQIFMAVNASTLQHFFCRWGIYHQKVHLKIFYPLHIFSRIGFPQANLLFLIIVALRCC